jgi:hypothetical protein
MGNDAIYPVLMAVALACAVIGFVHPMKALIVKPAEKQ